MAPRYKSTWRKVVHLVDADSTSQHISICGTFLHEWNKTTEYSHVTCKKCLRKIKQWIREDQNEQCGVVFPVIHWIDLDLASQHIIQSKCGIRDHWLSWTNILEEITCPDCLKKYLKIDFDCEIEKLDGNDSGRRSYYE